MLPQNHYWKRSSKFELGAELAKIEKEQLRNALHRARAARKHPPMPALPKEVIKSKSDEFRRQLFEQFRVGIVVATSNEYAAVRRALGDATIFHPPQPPRGFFYEAAKIPSAVSNNEVVVIFGQSLRMSNNHSAVLTSQMLTLFENVEDVVLTGIAAALPNVKNPTEDIWLGDVIVCDRHGVVQYDQLKATIDEKKYRDQTQMPSHKLTKISKYLEARRIADLDPWIGLDGAPSKWQITLDESCAGIRRPAPETDPLFEKRQSRNSRKIPEIRFGVVASANILLKDPTIRDKVASDFGAVAFEMEASGVADAAWAMGRGYFVIKGASDYGDGAKNDDWQEFAASTSAALTKLILSYYQ